MSLFIRFAKTIRHYAHLDGGWWLCLLCLTFLIKKEILDVLQVRFRRFAR